MFLELAASVAYVLTTVINYTLQRFWTFKSQRLHGEAVPRFLLMHAGGVAINAGILAALDDALSLPLLLSQLFAFATIAVWSYLLLKFWVFKT